jgi:hypothetical protein
MGARVVGQPQIVSSTLVFRVDVDGEVVRIASWSRGDLHVVDHDHDAGVLDAALAAAKAYARDKDEDLVRLYETVRRSSLLPAR